MTQNETIAALLGVAVLSYILGMRQASARATAAQADYADPMGWLNSWANV